MTATTHSFRELRLRGVSRSFGKAIALKELDLTLYAGEFVALLGPSGCGKSTALNCLAGLLPLTGGEIWKDEQRIDTLPPERRGFGMVFQSYALFPHLTIQRNVEFGLRMRGVRLVQRRSRAAEALRTVKLADHAHKRPAELSGGQQQRVAIARALAIEPDIILMDEPLSNLDASLRVELRTEIKRLHQSLGLSTLYVTHDQEEALSLADRVVILRDGRVEQSGPPATVYSRPASPYVAAFMGYRNLFTARATAAAGPGDTVSVHRDGYVFQATAVAGVQAGAEVTLAIRPDEVTVGEGGANQITLATEVVEFMGREIQVQGRMRDGQVLLLRTGSDVVPGDSVPVRLPRERLLAFGQVDG
ncbi:ABC transporter ATP-binding protein [Amycolatopsis suaedae]|uniref:ABC transporter ATP-binding protein n=1 Tax=Amycolatopsis suaedae TaxID=2510978 RepID=A0A4Q7J6E7_9PSEU|nr:ABC transporter ATP-binding protein [Amycolatopsis suaedae]